MLDETTEFIGPSVSSFVSGIRFQILKIGVRRWNIFLLLNALDLLSHRDLGALEHLSAGSEFLIGPISNLYFSEGYPTFLFDLNVNIAILELLILNIFHNFGDLIDFILQFRVLQLITFHTVFGTCHVGSPFIQSKNSLGS